MFWLENYVILLVFSVLWTLVSPDIYKSVMWTTNNPLFSASGKESRCFGEDLEMRVHLQSSLPIVCPFDFIIMKTLASKPATGVLYENFWIVYDEPSFRNCDINMTAEIDGEKNKKLLICDSPEALKSFTYSIDFKAKTPANSGLSFVGGRYYYFLTTSDGTDGSLNNTRGGHCNDPAVRMKFKVYICGTDDEKCQNVPIGEFLCPSDLPEASTTTSSPPTVPFEPSTQITTDSPGDTTNSIGITVRESSSGNTGTPLPTTIISSTAPTNFSNDSGGKSYKLESQDILDQLSWWKTAAIVIFCIWIFTVIVLLIVWYIKRRKKKPRINCFTDINKVTPPATEPQTPEYECSKEPNAKNSFNNLNYSAYESVDSVDGKLYVNCEMASLKPNGCPKQAVDKPDRQAHKQNDTQEKELEKPHPGVNSEKNGSGTPGGKDMGEKKQNMHKEKHDMNKGTPPETGPQTPECSKEPNAKNSFNNPSYTDDSEDGKPNIPQMAAFKPNGCLKQAVDKPDKQAHKQNNTQEKELEKPNPGMKSEKIGNGTPSGKDIGEKKHHNHRNNGSDGHPGVRHQGHLPPLKGTKNQHSPEKSLFEVNGNYLNKDQVMV